MMRKKKIKKEDLKNLKIAIVHEWFYRMAGSEKCVDAFCEMFPSADIFCTLGQDNELWPNIKGHKITFSFVNKIPFINKFYRYSYFLWPTAVETFNLNDYDLVLCSSHVAAKGAVTPVHVPQICYMYTPMRYAWDQSWDYFNPANFTLWKRLVIPFFLTFIRMWDIAAQSRPDKIATISEFVNRRIRKYYRQSADKVIYPPVDTDLAYLEENKGDYYACLAPFEPNKGGRLIVETAMKMGLKLKLVGEGSLRKELQKMSRGHSGIEYLGRISEEEKYQVLAGAKGFIFGGIEDFGISAVEAMACGTPVIAFAQGGALETVKDGVTGVFFAEPTVESLSEAITSHEIKLAGGKYDFAAIREHTLRFSRNRFMNEFSEFIVEAYNEHIENYS